MKNKNDCYTCPYREQVPGSAHSKCKVFNNQALAFAFSVGVASGEYAGIHDKESNEPLLKFDPHGVKSGWCSWPVNFDPTWVDCYLPIDRVFLIESD